MAVIKLWCSDCHANFQYMQYGTFLVCADTPFISTLDAFDKARIVLWVLIMRDIHHLTSKAMTAASSKWQRSISNDLRYPIAQNPSVFPYRLTDLKLIFNLVLSACRFTDSYLSLQIW
ncbi:MAG: hypothetical protein MJA29_13300 [Candidatus Omnitrophica bacterium]|nr:hypothetical protein [Candidatus Omnitrophota bacterium]